MKFITLFLCAAALLSSAAAFSFSVDRRGFVGAATSSLVIGVPSIALADAGEADADGFITTESGLKYKVLKEGTGATPEPGQTVKVRRLLHQKLAGHGSARSYLSAVM